MDAILLKNGLLIDGTGSNNVENASILIAGGKIETIFPSGATLPDMENIRTIDLQGFSILPGFINSHVHAGFISSNDPFGGKFHEDFLKGCIKEGVTTIRDEGMTTANTIEEVVEQKKLLEKSQEYPRIITTGKFFSAPGGYGGAEPITVETVQEAGDKVNEVLDKGIDMIKTVLEDGFDPSTFGLPKLSDELLQTICNEAHKRGAKVSAHVTQAHNLARLVNAGIDDAAHMVYDELPNELIHLMIEKNVYVVPTITIMKMFHDMYGIPNYKRGMDNVFKFVQAGGKIGVGNDFMGENLPYHPLGMPMLELELLKESGLSNMQIIVAATRHGAEICRIDHEVGTVEVGKKADLLIVKGNPLEDLSCISCVNMVMKAGKIVVEN